MQVLLVNSTCKVGGVSTFLLSLRRALVAAGHSCELFFFERGPMEAHLPADCPVHFGTLADCLRLIDARGITVVHANNIDWTTGISAVRRLGARLVLTAHKVREGAWTYGWRRHNCDALVAVSNWIRDDLQPHADLAIDVIHNGVDVGLFAPAAEVRGRGDAAGARAPIVAWVGRGSAPRKRLDLFAQSAPALRAAGFRIWVIDQQGPAHFADIAPESASLLASAAERWDGIAHARMPEIYREIARSAGCVVSTAQFEGLPLSLLEAQACGAIVVAARALGVDECVSATHGGVLFDAASDDLASVIAATLSDEPAVRARQRAAAAHIASNFSLERMARNYIELYSRQPRLARRLSSVGNSYRDTRLGVGYRQFETATALQAAGFTRLAAAAARAALSTAPTMFARPGRLSALAQILFSAGTP